MGILSINGEFVKNMGEAENIVGDWGMDKSHRGKQKPWESAFVGCVTDGCINALHTMFYLLALVLGRIFCHRKKHS